MESMKPPCSCKLKCYTQITEEQRKELKDEYYDLSIDRQRDFITRHVKMEMKARCRTDRETSRRNYTRTYYINGEKVCRVMFCNTLSISAQTITTAFEKKVGKIGEPCQKDMLAAEETGNGKLMKGN